MNVIGRLSDHPREKTLSKKELTKKLANVERECQTQSKQIENLRNWWFETAETVDAILNHFGITVIDQIRTGHTSKIIIPKPENNQQRGK